VANISFEQIKNEYDRASKLHKSGVLSKEEYEATYSSYLKAKEELSNAREALEIVKEGISSSTASYSNTQIKSTITGIILDIPV
jgi:HlyD family secretion protein